MKNSKSKILWIIVSLAAVVIIGRVGFLIAEIRQTEKGAGIASASAAEPNKPPEVQKPSDPNAPEKAAETKKPADSNDSQRTRPERGPRPGGEAGREGRTGRFGSSPEDRARMEEMRTRWENATDEEREELRAQMREKFGGRRTRGERETGGERAFGDEGGFGGERRPGGRRRPRDPNDPNAPSEPNEPAEPNKPSEPIDPNKIMELVNLKDFPMKDIVKKLAEWTGKVIIPSDDALKQKITIYSMKKLPRTQAIAMIYTALRAKGIIAEQTDDVIELKPIKDAKLGSVPTIAADEPLALIENKDQVVQKFFKLLNYNPSQMGDIILPLIGEYGYVSADESASSLTVIDTVANLMRIERIIAQFDLPETDQTVTKIFEIRHGNPEEIVRLLDTLLSDGRGSSARGPSRSGRPPSPPSSTPSKSSAKGGAATSVVVGTSQRPIVLIPEPKYNWIIAKASAEDMEEIGQWIEKLDKQVPTILVDSPLAKIENKNQVVQKFFKLENYSPMQMGQVVRPLLSEAGYVSSDETTGQLFVIDTVENLMRIEMIIEQFDVPEAEQTVTEIFEILHGDPSEIVQLLRMLLSDGSGGSARGPSRSSSYGGGSSYGGDSSYGRSGMFGMSSRYGSMSSPYRSSSRSSTATSVVIGPSQQPVVLIPEPKRKWIIARASAEDMKLIGEWIEKLDRKDPVEKEYETIPITYADVSEVASRLNEALEQMPGSDVRASVLVQPLTQARQIVIFGRKDLRDMVRKLIIEVDIPPGEFETKVFYLKHADPDQIKENIDNLYGESAAPMYDSYYYYRYGPGSRSRSPSEVVKVIAFPTMQQVTVIASPENMLKVAKQIEEWDAPLDVNEVKPRIIELHNTDPVQMADLLTTLFSESSSSGRGLSIYDIIYGRTEEKQKIVGPLYGQLTFEDVPGTKKIIVISKIAAAYDVVEQLIRDLDKAEMGEVPRVITLKYANPEDLAERLNAMFNEPGTTATIQRTDRGLSNYSMEAESGTSSSGQSGQDTTSQGEYRPWWTTGRQSVDEQPISNVIGRIRFVPDPRTKSILILAPPEFMDNIVKLIEDLDIPGKQVMIKAVIMQIDHSNVTSLGLQLRSGGFSDVGENAITIFNSLDHLQQHGALVFGAGGTSGSRFGFEAGLEVDALIDFLVKKTNAKILNQQTLWTKDNEEAMFFKGKRVAFFTTATSSATAGNVQNFEFQQVGMTLRVRPSITPENNVDMIINVILSQLTADRENSQPVRTEMDTTTNMIVQHSQTLMLGGILFQTDSKVERKLPVLGDMPVAGGLFRHNNIVESNEELIVFITPYVIDEPGNLLPETKAEVEPPLEKLNNIKEELEAILQPDS